MKKSELKQLIREVVQQILTENSTHDWSDGTQIVFDNTGKIVGGKFKGQDFDVSGWQDLGWANGWDSSYRKTKVEPATRGQEPYEIKIGDRGNTTMYIYPKAKISYMIDSSD